MYIAARGKSLTWPLLAITLFLSLLSVIIIQGVAAESAFYSHTLGSFSILPASRTINNNYLFSNFESSYLSIKGKFSQDVLKPEVHEAQRNQYIVSLNSGSSDEQTKAHMEINNGVRSWVLFDSKARPYQLEMTQDEYSIDSPARPANTQYLGTESGKIISVRDYTKFVQPTPFSRLADEIYENAGTDHQFIYEAWYVATHATTYAKEDVEQVNFPLDTLFLGKGDCEDLTILIASVLTASSHTKDWDIRMVYFDAFNPESSGTVNHVALYVDTGKESTFVESTTDSKGLNIWDKVDGWYLDV
jgi:hypothetical protein